MQEGFRIRQCQSSFQEWRVGKRRERGYSVTPLVPGFRDPNFPIRKNRFTDYIDCIWPMIATTSLQSDTTDRKYETSKPSNYRLKSVFFMILPSPPGFPAFKPVFTNILVVSPLPPPPCLSACGFCCGLCGFCCAYCCWFCCGLCGFCAYCCWFCCGLCAGCWYVWTCGSGGGPEYG